MLVYRLSVVFVLCLVPAAAENVPIIPFVFGTGLARFGVPPIKLDELGLLAILTSVAM